MHVLAYSVDTLTNAPNIAAELEVMADHMASGHTVTLVRCMEGLASCQVNTHHRKSDCFRCKTLLDNALEQINLPRNQQILMTPDTLAPFASANELAKLPKTFATLAELQAFEVDGADLGAGVASSVISELKNHKLDTQAYADKIYTKLVMAYQVYRYTQQLLAKLNPDRVYVFNGRVAEKRPVIAACKQAGVECYTIERAGDFGRYALFKNVLPHDLDYTKRDIANLWNAHDKAGEDTSGVDATAIAHDWFQKRRAGHDQGKPSHTKEQQAHQLPPGFKAFKSEGANTSADSSESPSESPEAGQTNIVIYNSSEYEYATIKGWQLDDYTDQNDAIARLSAALLAYETNPKAPKRMLWLRVHPNLSRRKNIQLEELKQLDAENRPNLKIIWPESPVDSYQLLDECDRVLTFSSTMGVEACYWQKPAILVGHAFYEDLDCCYRPQSHQELLELLTQKVLPPKPQENALPYGYRMKVNGLPYKRFTQTSYTSGLFNGKTFTSGEHTLGGQIRYQLLRKLDRFYGQFAKRSLS